MHKAILYIVIVILLIAVGGEYYYFHNQRAVSSQVMMAPNENQKVMKGGKGMPPSMSMTAVTPPPMSDQQKQQIAEGIGTSSTKKTFNITGGNFYFVPNQITVNKGDQVTFVLTNAGGFHDLVIDQLGVKTPVIKTGLAATVTFTASKTGSFVYYCNVSGHKAKGMWGTLIVK